MKLNELRIGNYVYAFKTIWQIDNTDFCNLEQVETYNFIPLTEEWLLKFGFESNPYQDRYENKVIQVECNKLRGYTELWIDGMPHIKYIHQLQNLYFALTGEELEIKE